MRRVKEIGGVGGYRQQDSRWVVKDLNILNPNLNVDHVDREPSPSEYLYSFVCI